MHCASNLSWCFKFIKSLSKGRVKYKDHDFDCYKSNFDSCKSDLPSSISTSNENEEIFSKSQF